MAEIWWWIRHILLILIGSSFLLFGIQVLISAYELKDPLSFIMAFFAASFIILISATLLVVFIYRIKAYSSVQNKGEK
jgi:hypothetical protein